jgi:hypothetical protein
MEYHATRTSTDRLKRVQQLPCFETASPDSLVLNDSVLGVPSLRIGNPIAVLVRSGGLVVLAIAQINRIRFAGRDNLEELPIHLLGDPSAAVDFQILRLRPATVEDDPAQVHDWCWSRQMEASCDNVQGVYVHPINPTISVQKSGTPTFLFESTFLVTLSCSLFEELRPQDRRKLPNAKTSEYFPYRSSGELDRFSSLTH